MIRLLFAAFQAVQRYTSPFIELHFERFIDFGFSALLSLRFTLVARTQRRPFPQKFYGGLRF
jgi:hypothetical protein